MTKSVCNPLACTALSTSTASPLAVSLTQKLSLIAHSILITPNDIISTLDTLSISRLPSPSAVAMADFNTSSGASVAVGNGVFVGKGVFVAVLVGNGVFVGKGVLVGMGVSVGSGVFVGSGVLDGVGVIDGVGVTVGVFVGSGVFVTVGVLVGVPVAVGVPGGSVLVGDAVAGKLATCPLLTELARSILTPIAKPARKTAAITTALHTNEKILPKHPRLGLAVSTAGATPF